MGAKRVIVPIPYSYIKAREVLPKRSVFNLSMAAQLYHQAPRDSCIIIIPEVFCRNEQVGAKKDYLRKLGVEEGDILVTEPSINTFTDALVSAEKIKESWVEVGSLIIIGDKYHMPRVNLIFCDRFPGVNIREIRFKPAFEADHPNFIQRRRLTWAPACAVMYWLMRLFGVRSWVSKLYQPRSE